MLHVFSLFVLSCPNYKHSFDLINMKQFGFYFTLKIYIQTQTHTHTPQMQFTGIILDCLTVFRRTILTNSVIYVFIYSVILQIL